MSFPTNSSPYGSNNLQIPRSPNQGIPGAPQSSGGGLWQSLFGRPEQNYQQSTLGQEQQPGYQNLLSSIQNKGAGGAFGQSADYYRDLLSDDSQTANSMFSPELRRYREQFIPELAEQFSGYGGIGSSGFRNAAVGGATDLSERLGAIRAQLRQQGAQGLSQIGQMGLGNYNENIHRPETNGLAGNFVEGVGGAVGGAITGGLPGAIGGFVKGASNNRSSSPMPSPGRNNTTGSRSPEALFNQLNNR